MMVRRKVSAVAAVVFLGFGLSACLPGAPPPPQYTHADGWAAVDQAFADHGPLVVAQAHNVAACESNHWPYARNGQYDGIFQLGDHYLGALTAAAQTLGRPVDWHDPYVNARAARIVWEQSGWRPWSCRP